MKNKKLFFLVFIFSVSFFSLAAYPYADQYLVQNGQTNITLPYSVGTVSVGNPAICDFKTDRSKKVVTLLAGSPGETQLIIYDDQNNQKDVVRIVVTSENLDQYIDELKRILKDIEGIKITRVKTKVLIEGEVFLPQDLETITGVTKNTSFVINRVELSKNSQRIIAKKIEKEIARPEVIVEAYKNKMILKGIVYDQAQADIAVKIAGLYWNADDVVSILEVKKIAQPPSRAKTVQVTAHYIELNKVLDTNFLFRWIPLPKFNATGTLNVNPQSGSTQIAGAVVATFTDLIPRLNYMKSLGIVKVLENPSVSVKSGETAKLFSGTTALIPVSTEGGAVTFSPQQIGMTLSVTPREFHDDIDLKVSANVSSLGRPSANGIINISTNSVDTSQFVRDGESIVIGGILRTAATRLKDSQPPAVQESPGLFTLYKTLDEQSSRSQFIIFITPKIVEYAKDANSELKEYFNLYEVYPD